MKEPYVPMKLNLLNISIVGFCGSEEDAMDTGATLIEKQACSLTLEAILNTVGGASVNLQNS